MTVLGASAAIMGSRESEIRMLPSCSHLEPVQTLPDLLAQSTGDKRSRTQSHYQGIPMSVIVSDPTLDEGGPRSHSKSPVRQESSGTLQSACMGLVSRPMITPKRLRLSRCFQQLRLVQADRSDPPTGKSSGAGGVLLDEGTVEDHNEESEDDEEDVTFVL
ncbi:hypothetical protein BD324DRAFT_653853 [Kockovaella imperatae]|uniref:Uncharacterized protein n=1 Tax=Kockovaella imperatae TaxID=4999 RepID=A0A1Y1U726_9TREE|nr:hypothetical protein BD324DRAFT_653853 [Kockovaella imperatae]ORX33802.1 hypothetical protein BD324DRAFT_653853 [Kockovaella imperatae]